MTQRPIQPEYVLAAADISGEGVAVRVFQLLEEEVDAFLIEDQCQRVLVCVDISQPDPNQVTFKRNHCKDIAPADDMPSTRRSFVLAVQYASWLAGASLGTKVFLGIQTVSARAGQLPRMDGGSLFGAAVLVLVRRACLTGVSSGWLKSNMASVLGVQVERMAVSAEFDAGKGRFADIGCLKEKIDALAGLWNQKVIDASDTPPPAVLVLPSAIPQKKRPQGPPNGRLKLLYCSNPAEVFEQVFEEQVRSTLFDAEESASMIWPLHVLTGNKWFALTAVVGTLAFWWWLSDFYIASLWGGWKPWMDRAFFILASALLVGLLGRWQRRLVRRSGFGPKNSGFVPGALSSVVWVDMLEAAARLTKHHSTRSFIWWRIRHLQTLPRESKLEATDILSVTAGGSLNVFKVLAPGAWLLGLWALLLLGPLYTNAMEFVAGLSTSRPNRIFDIYNRSEIVRDGAVEYPDEDLDQDRSTDCFLRRKTANLGQGDLTIRGTDFPRTYRMIVTTCLGEQPSCVLPGAAGAPDLRLPLRGGASTFAFRQTPGELRMNMELSLRTRRGEPLNYACIEKN